MGKLTGRSLRKLCMKGILPASLYWTIKRLKSIKASKVPILYTRKPFDLDKFNSVECYKFFRFTRHEIIMLRRSFGIPDICKLADRTKFTGVEGLCILLRRLSYPNRLFDFIKFFSRDEGSISKIFNWMVNFIYSRYKNKVNTLNQKWILVNVEDFLEKCIDAGCYFPNVVGFIDGTARPICRPGEDQKNQYSGYKKIHCLKYQSILFPNGFIGRLYGAFNGRRHDAAVVHLSELLDELKKYFINRDGSRYVVYGDTGYSSSTFIKSGYRNHNKLNLMQKIFNAEMSALRVSVEYGFGKILQQFAFLDYKKNQKLLLNPVKKMYFVAAFLVNCQICLKGSCQVSEYFDCMPPSLIEYLE